jgi:hypothetical protein
MSKHTIRVQSSSQEHLDGLTFDAEVFTSEMIEALRGGGVEQDDSGAQALAQFAFERWRWCCVVGLLAYVGTSVGTSSLAAIHR